MSCLRNRCGENFDFVRHTSRFIGKTVTIFTTSGGASGCGFTGTVISVNCNFVRLVTDMGTAPTNPLAENICSDMDDNHDDTPKGFLGLSGTDGNNHKKMRRTVGSVCDIPIDRIVAFCHNAI